MVKWVLDYESHPTTMLNPFLHNMENV